MKLALTNKVPVTPVRGAGQPQGVFAMERLLDHAARELGLDRAEMRRRNLMPAGNDALHKAAQDAAGGIQVVLRQRRLSALPADGAGRRRLGGLRRRVSSGARDGRYLGIGLANYVKGTGRGPFEHVSVRDRAVRAGSSLPPAPPRWARARKPCWPRSSPNSSAATSAISRLSPATPPRHALGIGGSNSRQAVIAGTSAHVAATRVREKVLAVAGQLLEVAPEDLEIDGRAVRVKGANLHLTLAQVARAAAGQPGFALPGGFGPGLAASEEVVIDAMSYANGTAVVEVEVDAETGAVTIRKIVFAHDCGRALHPRIVDGQLLGGIAHGVGNALYEHMRFDESAQPVTTTLADYLLVTATEMPPVTILHMESPTPLNPLGIKGVGEAGVIPIAAAVASAIEDALAPFAVRIDRMPVSPVDLMRLIKEHPGALAEAPRRQPAGAPSP